MIRIVGGIVILILLSAGLVVGFLALSGRVSLIPRASESSSLSLIPSLDSKERGKFFKVTVTANAPKAIKSTRMVILYDDTYLGAVKNIEVNKALGAFSIDTKTKGRIVVETKATGTAPKNSVLFSFQIKGQKITPDSGTKISILLKKSSLKDQDKKEMVSTDKPVEATFKVLSQGADINPPTCSALNLTPPLGTVGEEITAHLVATATNKALKNYSFTFGLEGSQTVGAGKDGKHKFAAAGTYTVDGKATDIAGNVSDACSSTIQIAAAGQTPLPLCTNFTLSPQVIKTGNQASALVAGVAGTGATIAKYTVNFDDGDSSIITQTSVPVTYTYQTAGTYLLTASVTDSKDQVSTQICTKSIEVTALNENSNDKNDNDENDATHSAQAFDCDKNGSINILDFTCFKNDYGKKKNNDSGDWE